MAAPVVARAGPQADAERKTDPTWRQGLGGVAPRPVAIALGVAVVAGVALRAYTRSELWLDEALTVNIARLPLSEMVPALRRDGAPPLYYLLLHAWIAVLGTGNFAARLPSALFGVAVLPLIYRAGRRLGGDVVAIGGVVLFATSPFAIRYATEARQYTLVVLLVVAAYLALRNALERPRLGWLLLLAALTGALLLTHYWAFYLCGVTWLSLAALTLRHRAPTETRRAAQLAAGAMAAGAVVFFGPWVPSFLYQRAHTGTPWGTAPGPVEVMFTTLVDLGGGPYPEGQALAGMLAALAMLALLGRAIDGWRVELDLRTRPGIRPELAVAGITLLVGVGIGTITASAFASRYTSVAFPLILLVAAYGLRSFADRRTRAAVLAIVSLLGVVGGVRNGVTDRTQAPEVARAIAANGGRPGDVVVYCPDQLGPDVSRLLDRDHTRFDYRQFTFPDLADPGFVDWVDYGPRMAAADPGAFGREVLQRSTGSNIWYVWMPGYRTLDKQCERVNETFGQARPGNRQLVEPDEHTFERHVLWLHPASGA